jgi:hypothetical protein
MNIRLKICTTTDGKFVGQEIDWNGISLQINGFTYEQHEVINLENGFWRIHNSNYSVDAQQLED